MARPLKHHHILHGVKVQSLHRPDEDLSLMFTTQTGSLQEAGSASLRVIHLFYVDPQVRWTNVRTTLLL